MPVTPHHPGLPITTGASDASYQQEQQQVAPPSPPPLPPPPPVAPPLPSTKYVQRAATAFGRLTHPFFLGSRPSSAQGHRDGGGRPERIRPAVQRSSSPVSSKSTTHKTGIPIAALDISPERTHAILAGRDILKTIRVSETGCAEDFNLRSKINAYASAHHASRDALAAQHRDQLAAKDVKWSRGNFSTTVATAAANGRIVIYDINRPNIELGRLHEHTRQVHKLAFNPHQGALLISGSQDGTVRLWDMRDLRTERAARISGSIKRFMGHSEGVRDLKWSPADGIEFASGTDGGIIQRWDIRKEKAPILKLNAHDKTCMSLDWHPSGRYLASGSADRTIKIWDFRSADRRMKPNWQLRAPSAVTNVRWRPGSAAPPNEGSSETRSATYLASSYDARDPRIHIWDLRRPHVPFQEIDRYETPATDMLWHSEDLLWSVGYAGMFTQTDINFVPKPLDRISVNILTSGPEADLCFFTEPRIRKRMPLTDAEELFLRGVDTRDSSGEKLSGSHSANEGSFEEASNMNNPLKKRRPKFTNSRFTSQTSSSSVGVADEGRVAELPDLEALYRSTQTAAIGRVFGVFNADSFRFLCSSYQLPKWQAEISDQDILDEIKTRFEHNALMAGRTGQHRLAQTWRILEHAIRVELSARLDELNREHSRSTSAVVPSAADLLRSPRLTFPVDVSKSLYGLSRVSESGSNVPTPLARPVRDLPSIPTSDEHSLEHDSKALKTPLTIPAWQQRRASVQLTATLLATGTSDTVVSQASSHSAKAHSDAPQAPDTSQPPQSIVEFPDFEQHMQEQRSAMNNYRARPRTLLRLDDPGEDNPSLRSSLPPLDRHDSNESFHLLSGSTDSEPQSITLTSSFGESQSANASAANSFESRGDPNFASGNAMRQSQLRHSQATAPAQDDQADTDSIGSAESPLNDDMSFVMDQDMDTRETTSKLRVPELQRPTVIVAPVIYRDNESDKEELRTKQSAHLFTNPVPPAVDAPPWTLSALLPPLLEYHLETLCDTQLPSILAIFLYPLFPALFEQSPPPPTYLLAYHELLVSLQLFIEAAALRNAALHIFPDVGLETTVEQGRGTGADQAGLWCSECHKPVKGSTSGWCMRCSTAWGPCAICELPFGFKAPIGGYEDSSRGTTDDTAQPAINTNLWSWCQDCGHGGHTACLRVWWGASSGASDAGVSSHAGRTGPHELLRAAHADTHVSDGACPVAGCLHACIAGPRRDAALAARAAAASRQRGGSGSVARDSWVAGESRAVETAIQTLSRGPSTTASTGVSTTDMGSGAATAASSLGQAATTLSGRSSLEEAIVVVDGAPHHGGDAVSSSGDANFAATRAETSRDGVILPRSLSGGGRSLSGSGRSFSGGGRRVRLAVPSGAEVSSGASSGTLMAGARSGSASLGSTPPAAHAAVAGLRGERSPKEIR